MIFQNSQRRFIAQKATLKARARLTCGKWSGAGAGIWTGPSQMSVPTLTPGPLDLLLLSTGRGADLHKGPQPPRGPQPAAHSPGRLLHLLPQRVGAILPGVDRHSL